MPVTVLKPIIERLGEDIPLQSCRDITRKRAARWICQYLESRDKQFIGYYYTAVEYLLNNRDYERVLLYLPFDELADAPESFKRAYMDAWWHLTNVQDASENFHEGDVFEIDARPNGELTRVVKCAHFLPWLIQAKYLNKSQIATLFHDKQNELFVQSLRDTLPYIADHKLLSQDFLLDLDAETWGLDRRKKISPLYISAKRQKWLEEKDKTPAPLATPSAHLEGPFFDNLKSIDLGKVTEGIEPSEIRLVGGSRFKGYGTTESDLDIWEPTEMAKSDSFYPGSPHAAHVYFNTAWVCGPEVTYPDGRVIEILKQYSNSPTRKQSLERIESDLCLYRLLHKGFTRFHNMTIFETSPYLDMDGDCPFYDDEYRRVATMLFAKYVFIPDFN